MMYVMEGAGRVHAAPCSRRINSFSRLRVDCVKERSGEKSFSLLFLRAEHNRKRSRTITSRTEVDESGSAGRMPRHRDPDLRIDEILRFLTPLEIRIEFVHGGNIAALSLEASDGDNRCGVRRKPLVN